MLAPGVGGGEEREGGGRKEREGGGGGKRDSAQPATKNVATFVVH